MNKSLSCEKDVRRLRDLRKNKRNERENIEFV